MGKFIELSRRQRKLRVEDSANQAGIEAAEVLQAEDEDTSATEPRVIFALANFLHADATKLLELSGHVERRTESLDP